MKPTSLQEMLDTLTLSQALKWQSMSYSTLFILNIAELDNELRYTSRWVRKIKERFYEILSEAGEL